MLVKIAIKKEILSERSEFISFQLFLLTNGVKTGFSVLIFASLYQDKDERMKRNLNFKVFQPLIRTFCKNYVLQPVNMSYIFLEKAKITSVIERSRNDMV